MTCLDIFRINLHISYYTVMLAGKWFYANISCRLMEVNWLSNIFPYPFSFQLLITQEVMKW